MKHRNDYVAGVLGAVVALAGCAVLARWWRSSTPWQLREQLQSLSPLLLEITLALIVIALILNVAGVAERPVFLANNIIFAVWIITVFCTGFLLFHSAAAGLYAAAVLALTPQAIMWSNTMAVEPSAALFGGLAVLSALVFVRLRDARSLVLLTAVSVYAAQFRTESMMILAAVVLIMLVYARDEFKRGRLYLCLGLGGVLLMPHLTHLYAVRAESWGAAGAKLALEYVAENIRVNSLFYVENTRFPLLFTLLWGAGLLLPRLQNLPPGAPFAAGWLAGWREKCVLLIWFAGAWGIFLFFYAGSYNYGVDVRYSLLSYMPLAVLAGYGAAALAGMGARRVGQPYVHAIVCSVIGFAFVSFLPLIRAEGEITWSPRADHRFARECADLVPDDAVILTHNPNMFLLWGKNAAQASLATEHPRYFNGFFYRYKGGVYFYYNFWCNVNDPLQNAFCTNILQRYDCTEIAMHQERNYRFALYRVERKQTAPSAPRSP
jgi:hypothetical protein